jgi:hypothetical protein
VEIKTDTYTVKYDEENNVILCEGTLRLSGMEEYSPVVELLNAVVEKSPPLIKLDLRKLEFLNSSGINVLSKFIIKVRQHRERQAKESQIETNMVVYGSQTIPWQSKSIKNLQRLMPSLELEWDKN